MNGVNELTNEIIGAAIEVHRTLGPGLLESTYEGCLLHELAARKLSGASSMSFQNNLCDLRVLGGEYLTAIWVPNRAGRSIHR
jgi:GxxExxY protein